MSQQIDQLKQAYQRFSPWILGAVIVFAVLYMLSADDEKEGQADGENAEPVMPFIYDVR